MLSVTKHCHSTMYPTYSSKGEYIYMVLVLADRVRLVERCAYELVECKQEGVTVDSTGSRVRTVWRWRTFGACAHTDGARTEQSDHSSDGSDGTERMACIMHSMALQSIAPVCNGTHSAVTFVLGIYLALCHCHCTLNLAVFSAGCVMLVCCGRPMCGQGRAA